MSSQARRPATILQHGRSEVFLVDNTGLSVDASKAYQRKERLYTLASVLASFDGVLLRMAEPRERDHYLHAAGMAMDCPKERLGL
jgi:hypothetical protein